MILKEPPASCLRFVDDTSKLTKNQPCSECYEETPAYSEEYTYNTDIYLIPPFVWSGSTFYTPTSFWLRTLDGGSDINLAGWLSGIQAFTIGSIVYVAYKGQSFNSSSIIPTPLIPGYYQCEVSDGINTIYSEPIRVCEDLTHCIRLSWSHSCDVAGIPYSYINGLAGGTFRNIMYIQAPIIQPEYETEKEESTNLLRQKTVIYSSQERTLRFKTVGDAWIARALKSIELHNDIDIYTNFYSEDATFIESATDIFDVSVKLQDIEKSECAQEIEFSFKMDDAIISGICCVNETPDACLTSCYTVLGFWPEGECTEGAYYMDDVDSGIIVQCVGGEKSIKSTTCVYCFNDTDDNYYYFDGDLWHITPDIDFDLYLDLGSTAQVDLSGFTIPGTWVYIYYSCDGVTFTRYPIPFSATQLGSGISITIPKCLDTYYLYATSQNHTCTYDNSDTINFTPA